MGPSRWAHKLGNTDGIETAMSHSMRSMQQFTSTDLRLEEGRRDRLAYKIVKTGYFDALSYVLIIANSVFIGASMEHRLSCAIEGRTADKTFEAVETAFVIWFSMELLLKLLAEDVRVFSGKDRWWNLLDLVLVASAVGQLAAESGAPNISLTRNVRLFRVVRILRLVRVVRVCQSLRVMILTILRSLDALLWVLVVLAFFMYIFAMAFMHGTIEQFRDNEATWLFMCPNSGATCPDGSECAARCAHLTWLDNHLGSLTKMMLTLFQSITGGRDWAEVYDELDRIHGVHSSLFVLFIYFMVFLVLNVVIATVVNVTSGVSSRDRDSVVDVQMKLLKNYTIDIKEFFKSADTDGSGQLSFEEFSRHLKHPRVKAYFTTLDLDTRQSDILFKLLDQNESGEVGISEFLDGCLRLKGGARNLDMNLATFQLEHLLKEIQQLRCEVSAAAGAPTRASRASA